MSKKILLIESDAATASAVSRSLEGRGLEVRVTGDGKEGLALARDARPDAIVLCVELDKMSGYAICQKLRKDEGLRTIPLILTSAEATEAIFESHKKLKVRADDYLLKPYAPSALLARLAGLMQIPEPAAEGEELVTLDDVTELSGEMPLIPEGETVRAQDAIPEHDEDLKLLDDAFDSISADAPLEPARPAAPPAAASEDGQLAGEDLRAAAELLPAEDPGTHAAIDKLGEEADRALDALGADEPAEGGSAAAGLDEDPLGALRAPSPDALASAGMQQRLSALLAELAEEKAAAARWEAEAAELRASGDGLAERLRAMESELAGRDPGEARRDADARVEAEERFRLADEARAAADQQLLEAQESARRAEEEAARVAREAVEQGRSLGDRSARLEGELATIQLRVEEAEQTASLKAAQLAEARNQVAALEAELAASQGLQGRLEALRSELESVQSAHEAARSDLERRSIEAERRVADLEAVNAKHEERVVKAYQKIKSDEKIREKTRKALAIALQLLDERISAAAPKDPTEPVPRRE